MSMSRIEDLLEQILDKINGGSNGGSSNENEPIIITPANSVDNVSVPMLNMSATVDELQSNVEISNNVISGELNYFYNISSDYSFRYFLALNLSISGMTRYEDLSEPDPIPIPIYKDSDNKKYMFSAFIIPEEETFEDIIGGNSLGEQALVLNNGLVILPFYNSRVDSLKAFFLLIEINNNFEPVLENGPKYVKELSFDGLTFANQPVYQ